MGHYTHEKSPIGCAAALATMEAIEQDGLLDKAKVDSQFMREKLLEMKAKYPVIGDVRGIGMLWGIELVTDHESKARAYDEAEAVLYQCLNNGVSFKVSQGNVIQLSPPLIITREQLIEALAIFEEAIATCVKTLTTFRVNRPQQKPIYPERGSTCRQALWQARKRIEHEQITNSSSDL